MLVLKTDVLMSPQMMYECQETWDASWKGSSKSELMHKKLTRLVRCLCYICAAERAARQLFLDETCDVPETFQALNREAVCNQFTTLWGCSTMCVIIFPKYLGKIQMVSEVL